MHLLVSFIFYIDFSQSEIRASIRTSIGDYLMKSKFDSAFSLEDVQSGYLQPVERILDFNYSQIGF